MSKNQLVEQNFGSIRNLFESDGMQRQLKRAVPQTVKVDTLVRVALTVIRTNPTLLESTQQSLLACLMGCAQLGLSPEPFLGQAYFVPFWSSKLNQNEARLIPGYRGYITLARRSGELDTVEAQAVYSNDEFNIRWGLDRTLDHIPATAERGDLVGAWTIFSYKNEGRPTFDYMNFEDIEKIMQRTKSRNRDKQIVGPWITDKPEMAKKSVIRRHIKLAPLSVEDKIVRLAHAENLAIEGQSQVDFFLPEAEQPIMIGSGTKEPDIDDRVVKHTFSVNFGQIAGEALTRFLNVTAEANECSIVDVMRQANENVELFKQVFSKWQSAQPNSKKDPGGSGGDNEPGKDDKPVLDDKNWKNLQKDSFKKFVVSHALKIADAPEPIVVKIKEKWARLLPDDPFPFDTTGGENDGQAEAANLKNKGSDSQNMKTSDNGAPDGSNQAFVFDPGGNTVEVGLTESDQWSELSMLQSRYPDIYKEKIGGRALRTIADLDAAIMAIEDGIAEQEFNEGGN